MIQENQSLFKQKLEQTEVVDDHEVDIKDEDEIQDHDSTPNLTRLTDVALTHLTAKQKPFVLLVECEEMDSASHANDSKRVVKGLKSIQETLKSILRYSEKQGETLVLFTADHETGGLSAVSDFNDYPNMQIRWSTKEHTAAIVPLFADGPGADFFSNVYRNREIGDRLKKLIHQDSAHVSVPTIIETN